jgi:hypothetical protein
MTRFVVACCAVFSFSASLFAADPATSPSSQTKPATAPASKAQPANLAVENALGGIVGGFSIIETLIELSPEEKAKADALLEKIKEEARARPELVLTDGARARFSADVERRYRAILTPANLKALDERIAKDKKNALQQASRENLRTLYDAFKRYADEHKGKYPNRIYDLIETGYASPHDFLRNGVTRVPQEVMRTARNQQAVWTERASEYLFMASGREPAKLDPKFVVICDKEGTAFLCADSSMPNIDVDLAAKVFAELKAGKNPPPSLAGK